MTGPTTMDARVEQLGRASRRAALLSLFGFLLIIIALAYAGYQLSALQRETQTLTAQRDTLGISVDSLKRSIVLYREEAAQARKAVAASRAAINAFHSGRLQEAVRLYDEALAADPANAYLQNLRAYALFRLRRYPEAIEGQRKGLAADRNYAWGYFDLARFLCASGASLSEAKEAANRAIALRPDLRSVMAGDGEFQRVCAGNVP